MKYIKITMVHENSNNYKAGIQMTEFGEGNDEGASVHPL